MGTGKKINTKLSRLLSWSCKAAGKPITFVVAWSLLVLWLIIGFILGFTDTWLLIINTVATINASLMVFIIQNTQNRESKVLQIKLDELIKAVEKAEQELIAIETLEEDEIDFLRKKHHSKKTGM